MFGVGGEVLGEALAPASSAAGVCADSEQQLPCFAARRRPGTGASGASSSTTCALVPPMPNELTPAAARPARRRHGVSDALT